MVTPASIHPEHHLAPCVLCLHLPVGLRHLGQGVHLQHETHKLCHLQLARVGQRRCWPAQLDRE
jgi:hypothetical protein